MPFAKYTVYLYFYSVAEALRIWNRSERFSIPFGHHLAVFIEIEWKKKKRLIKCIDDIHISTFLKKTTKTVHSITSKKELARFTAHSIRVRACAVIHTNESSIFIIQVRLRWKSDAFKFYLRNVESLVEHQMDVLLKSLL